MTKTIIALIALNLACAVVCFIAGNHFQGFAHLAIVHVLS